MGIVFGTLAQEVDGKIEYVYPKTMANMVEFDENGSIENKIEKIDDDIAEVNARVNNIAAGVKYGSIGTKNDAELIDIRVPSYNIAPKGVVYDSASQAIKAQLEILLVKINEIQTEVEEIKAIINA